MCTLIVHESPLNNKTMHKIIMILKGILLWFTAFMVSVTLCSLDLLLNESIFIFIDIIATNCLLLIMCYVIISKKEFYILSGNKLINNLLKVK